MTPAQKARFEDLDAWAQTYGLYVTHVPEKFVIRSTKDSSDQSPPLARLVDVREALVLLTSEKPR